LAADGGVFAEGDAGFFGSSGGKVPAHPVAGLVAAPNGAGYSIVLADGSATPFGNAP
jgi:hypothetical protein